MRPFLRPLINEEWRRGGGRCTRSASSGGRSATSTRASGRWARWPPLSARPGRPRPADNPCRMGEKAGADMITTGLDLYRDLRDAAMEAAFFQIYGGLVALGARTVSRPAPARRRWTRANCPGQAGARRHRHRGYPEAVALIGALLGKGAGPFQLTWLEVIDRLIRSDETLSRLPDEQIRRIRAEQEWWPSWNRNAVCGRCRRCWRQRRTGGGCWRLLDETVAPREALPRAAHDAGRIRGRGSIAGEAWP
ncbi:MAG: hypothetical protein U0736_01425 [Gemmataceae bacterium]